MDDVFLVVINRGCLGFGFMFEFLGLLVVDINVI